MALAPDPIDMARETPRHEARAISAKRASTFFGFCNAHDAVFTPVDHAFSLSAETAFLLHYRAVCFELHKKRTSIEVFKAMVAQSRGDTDRYNPAVGEEFYRSGTAGSQEGIHDLEKEKETLDAALRNRDWSACRFGALVLGQAPRIMCSGAFAPEWDLAGATLQNIASKDAMQLASLNIVGNGGRGLCVVAWYGEQRACSRFAESLISTASSSAPDVILRVALQLIENVYCAPSWWPSLSDAQRSDILRRVAGLQDYSEFSRVGASTPAGLEIVEAVSKLT